MQRSNRARLVVLTCLLAISLHPGGARAEEGQAREAALGAGAALATLVYTPLKVGYAALGLVMGGLAWGLSGGDSEVLHAIVTPSIRGDYVVTPDHLRRRRDLAFFGRDPAYRPDDGLDSGS